MAEPIVESPTERTLRRSMADVDLVTHLYTRRALWGTEAVLYRREHPMEWRKVAGNYQNWLVDTADIVPSDAESGGGEATRLFYSDDVDVWISRRCESMPFFFRNCDADELHIISQGELSYETDFGNLSVGPRDLLVIPKGVTYRATLDRPHDTLRLIFESRPEMFLVPTEMVDHVYHKGRPAVDPDRVEKPTLPNAPRPGGEPALSRAEGPALSKAEGYEVRVKYTGAFSDFLGQTSSIVYDFHPFDAEIIDGTTNIYKFSISDIEKLGTNPVPFIGGAYLDNKRNLAWTLHLSGGGEGAPVHRNPDVDEFRYLSSGPRMGAILFSPQGVDHGAGRGYTRRERNRPENPYDTGDTISAYTFKPLKGTPEAYRHAKPIMC